MARASRAMRLTPGGARSSTTCSNRVTSSAWSTLPTSAHTVIRGSTSSPPRATSTSLRLCTGSARPEPWARWIAFIPTGRRGATAALAKRDWRRCVIWCQCWGLPSSRRHRPISRARSDGSISDAKPPNRCCAERCRAASPRRSRRSCGSPTCARRPPSASGWSRARSFRSSMTTRRPRSTPSMMPAAKC